MGGWVGGVLGWGRQTASITLKHRQVAPIAIWGNKCTVRRWSVSGSELAAEDAKVR